jgi:hypothetical protein
MNNSFALDGTPNKNLKTLANISPYKAISPKTKALTNIIMENQKKREAQKFDKILIDKHEKEKHLKRVMEEEQQRLWQKRAQSSENMRNRHITHSDVIKKAAEERHKEMTMQENLRIYEN